MSFLKRIEDQVIADDASELEGHDMITTENSIIDEAIPNEENSTKCMNAILMSALAVSISILYLCNYLPFRSIICNLQLFFITFVVGIPIGFVSESILHFLLDFVKKKTMYFSTLLFILTFSYTVCMCFKYFC